MPYGSVCSPCFALCQFPVESAAVGLAALAEGRAPLTLGFNSYATIRARYAAQEAAEALREAQAERARLEAQRARVEALRDKLRRAPRRKRAELAAQILRAAQEAAAHPLSPVPERELQDAPGFPKTLIGVPVKVSPSAPQEAPVAPERVYRFPVPVRDSLRFDVSRLAAGLQERIASREGTKDA